MKRVTYCNMGLLAVAVFFISIQTVPAHEIVNGASRSTNILYPHYYPIAPPPPIRYMYPGGYRYPILPPPMPWGYPVYRGYQYSTPKPVHQNKTKQVEMPKVQETESALIEEQKSETKKEDPIVKSDKEILEPDADIQTSDPIPKTPVSLEPPKQQFTRGVTGVYFRGPSGDLYLYPNNPIYAGKPGGRM